MSARAKYLVLLLMLLAFHASAANFADTTKKRLLPGSSKLAGYQNSSFLEYMKEAVTLFLGDNIDKGVSVLADGIKQTDTDQKFTGLLPYREYELLDLIRIMDSGQLTRAEKQLGRVLVRSIFIEREGQTKEKNMALYLKAAGNTLFSHRVKLLMLTYTDLNRAQKELDKLLQEAPDLIPANMYKAELLYSAQQYQECVKYSTRLLTTAPKNIHAIVLRADSYLAMNEQAKAVTDYDAILKRFPAYTPVLYNRAAALYGQEKYRPAISAYQQSYMANTDYGYPMYNIARSYTKLEMPDSALYYVTQHIGQYPNDASGYQLKGDIFYDREDYPAAIDFYTRAIQIDPDRDDLYDDRANAYYYAERIDEAIADFEIALKTAGKNAYDNDHLGDCYYRKKDYKRAISYHQAAVKIDPKYKSAYVGLGLSYNQLGMHTEAINANKKAVAIDSTYATALGNLGWSYYCIGDNDACIEYSYRAIKQDSEAVYARFNIALANLKKGQIGNAQKLYRDFYNECKTNGYPINDGAVDDLRELIRQRIAVSEAESIIRNVFGETP